MKYVEFEVTVNGTLECKYIFIDDDAPENIGAWVVAALVSRGAAYPGDEIQVDQIVTKCVALVTVS